MKHLLFNLGLSKSVFLLTTIVLLTGCFSSEPTDEELLQRDRETLEESLNSIPLDYYKVIKTSLRVMPVLDTTNADHRKIKELNDRIWPGLYERLQQPNYVRKDTVIEFTFENVAEFLSAYMSLL